MTNPLEIIGDVISGITGFIDDMHDRGYMWYLFIGLLILIALIAWNMIFR